MSSSFERGREARAVLPEEKGPLQAGCLRIAMISLHSSPAGELGTHDTGGMSVYIRELARELGRRGHSVDIYTRWTGAGLAPVVVLGPNVRLIHLNIGRNGHQPKSRLDHHVPDFFLELQKFIHRNSCAYDLIHSHYWLSGRLGDRARMLWALPHVMTFHTLGILQRTTGQGNAAARFRVGGEMELVRSCRRIVVATEREKDDLICHYAAHPDKVGVVSCGVNTGLFRPMNPSSARRKLNLPLHKQILLYVGRFAQPKGLERLLRAMALLQVDEGIRLLMVGGDGPGSASHEAMVRLVKRYGVHERVRFEGRVRQPELPRYYSAADLLVVPSDYESFGLVALEALACGTPVVATPVGAMPDIIVCGKTGIVVPGFSDAALATGIASALGAFRKTDQLQEMLRASVLNYDWEHAATAMLDQYRAVLEPCPIGLEKATGGLGLAVR